MHGVASAVSGPAQSSLLLFQELMGSSGSLLYLGLPWCRTPGGGTHTVISCSTWVEFFQVLLVLMFLDGTSCASTCVHCPFDGGH